MQLWSTINYCRSIFTAPAQFSVFLPPTGEIIRFRTNYFESIVVPTILELHKHWSHFWSLTSETSVTNNFKLLLILFSIIFFKNELNYILISSLIYLFWLAHFTLLIFQEFSWIKNRHNRILKKCPGAFGDEDCSRMR